MSESNMHLHKQQPQNFASLDCHSIEDSRRHSYGNPMLIFPGSSEKPGACVEYGDNSASLFVVIPRMEYDFLRREIAELNQSFDELKHRVENDINLLKSESRTLKQVISKCSCVSSNGNTVSNYSANRWNGCGIMDGAAWNVDHTDRQHNDMRSRSTDSSANKTTNRIGCCGLLSSPSYTGSSMSGSSLHSPDRSRLVQLLPSYDVWVNRLSVQIIVNEASTRKTGGALFLLRRVIPLVFTWDELACSRGQGLNSRTAVDLFVKLPLDPVKVSACKAFMRKFCADCGCPEPSERCINQTFSHQVNYARRRLKSSTNLSVDVKPEVFLHDEDNDVNSSSDKGLEDTKRYTQM